MDWINGETIGILLFFIGFLGVVSRKSIMKSIISVGIMQVAVILFFLSSPVELNREPPIGIFEQVQNVSDPLPQALMITDIVIGIGVTAVALTLTIHLYHSYGTGNWHKAKEKRLEE